MYKLSQPGYKMVTFFLAEICVKLQVFEKYFVFLPKHEE